MEAEGDAYDVYVAQLRDVFDSCDTSGTGKLSRAELHDLCVRLQLEDQRDQLVNQLLGSDLDARVTFDEFKEGFVSVLAQSVEGMDTGSEGEEEEENEDIQQEHAEAGQISPKYVKGHKKYGRRSVPEGDPGWDIGADWSGEEGGHHTPEGTSRNGTPLRGQSPDSVASYVSSTGSRNGDKVPPINLPDEVRTSGDGTKSSETFEAEGQLNKSLSGMESALDPVSEEEHLKDVWRELGVGKDGYLDLYELTSVCEHIGMEEMNAEEVQHLFDKLDVDGDGRVSFQEFLQGLFQHGSPATPSTPGRPMSTPRSKIRLQMSMAGEDRIQTPSFFSAGSGLFTVLDPDNTGFANPEAIMDLWDSSGIPLGADVLDYLGFDIENKINLSDLSYALEQFMKGVEDTNATYQAGLASCQLEIKHLKSTNDHLTGEREKMRSDLAEANQRISFLVREGDERYSSLERSKEKELLNVEKKYQDQIKTLQAEIEREREVMMHQSAKQRQKLEAEIDRLKDEEWKLKDKLAHTQKELEKLESEIMEMADRCSDLERHNDRQQRELQSAAELQRKLEEMGSNRDQLQDEKQKFADQKLQHLEGENKDLKDKIDELTMENEDLKQQLEVSKRGAKSGRIQESLGPRRSGSILSDYAKPNMTRASIGSDTSENSEDDNGSTSGRTRRKLPRSPDELEKNREAASLVPKLQSELALASKERDALQEQCAEKENELQRLLGSSNVIDDLRERLNEKEQELRELRAGLESERKDIEQSFKMEVTDLEEQFNQEKEDMLESFQAEKEMLTSEHAEKLAEELAALESRLESEYDQQKQDLLIRAESEKNLREQRFAEDQLKLINKMRDEFAEDLDSQLKEQQKKYTAKIDEASTRDESFVENMRRQRADMTLELRDREEELEILRKENSIMERKLHLHEDDLKRLGQEKSEIDKKLHTKEEEIKNLEKENIILEKKLNRHGNDLEKLDMEKKDIENKLYLKEQEIKTLEKDNALLEMKLNLHGNNLQKLNQERSDLEKTTNFNVMEVEQLKAGKSYLEKNVSDLEKNIADLEMKIKIQTQEIAQLRKEKSQLEDLEIKNKIQAQEITLMRTEKSRLEDLEIKNKIQAQEIAQLRREKSQMEDLEIKMKTQTQELTQLGTEKYKLEDLEKKIKSQSQDMTRLRKEKSKLENDLEEMRGENEDMKQEKSYLEERLERQAEKITDLKNQLSESKSKMKALKEEIKTEHKNERDDIKMEFQREREDFQKEKANFQREKAKHKKEKESLQRENEKLVEQLDDLTVELQDKRNTDSGNVEDIFNQGERALKGKLRKDFYSLLDKRKFEDLRKEKTKIAEVFEEEKRDLEEMLENEKADLARAYSRDCSDLERRYKQKISDLEKQLDYERERHDKDLEVLRANLLRERDAAVADKDGMHGVMEAELTREIQARLEIPSDAHLHLGPLSPDSFQQSPSPSPSSSSYEPNSLSTDSEFFPFNTGNHKPPVKVEFSTFKETETETTRETLTTYKRPGSKASGDENLEESCSKLSKTKSDITVEKMSRIGSDPLPLPSVQVYMSGFDSEMANKGSAISGAVTGLHGVSTESDSCLSDCGTERLEKILYRGDRLSTVLAGHNKPNCAGPQLHVTGDFETSSESGNESIIPGEKYLGTGKMPSVSSLEKHQEIKAGYVYESNSDSSPTAESEIDRVEKFYKNGPNGLFAYNKQAYSIGVVGVSGSASSDSETVHPKPNGTFAVFSVGKQEGGMGLYTMSGMGGCSASDSETERLEKKCAGPGRMSTLVSWGKSRKGLGIYQVYGSDAKDNNLRSSFMHLGKASGGREMPKMGSLSSKGEKGICALCRRPLPGANGKPKPRLQANSGYDNSSHSKSKDSAVNTSVPGAHGKSKPNVRVEFSTFTESESETTKEEFVHEIARVKGAYEDERGELESRIRLLQTELEDIQKNQELDDKRRTQAQKQNREQEAKYRKQLEELNRKNTLLSQEKQRAEKLADEFKSKFRKMLDDNQNRNREYEEHIERLIVEKEEAVTAVTTTNLMAPAPSQAYGQPQSERDQAILDAIASQKDLLENKTQELKNDIQSINRGPRPAGPLKGAYDNVLAEKRALETAVKGMQNRMQELIDRSTAADHYKARLANWEAERSALMDQLRTTEEQLAEAQTVLSLSQSEHVREIQGLREQNMKMVDLEHYTALQGQVMKLEQRIRELETQLQQRAAETSQLIMGTQEDHKRVVQQLQLEKETLERKLGQTSNVLDEQVTKLKAQLERSAKTDYLIKELYVENSQLMMALQETEKREKQANKQVFHLEDQCKALKDTVRKVCAAASAS